MKLTQKQKIQKIEQWLDQLREDEKIHDGEKDNITIPVGNSKVFLDKNNKKNDKVLVDYVIIKRNELSMLDKWMIESIFKLASSHKSLDV